MSERARRPHDGGAFSPVVVVAVVLVAAASGLAFLALTAFAPELRSGSSGANASSNSAVGFAAVVQLMREQGAPVTVSRDPRPGPGDPGAVRVMAPDLGVDPKALRALLGGADTLVVLPKWISAPDPLHPGWARKIGLLDARLVGSDVLGPLQADLDAPLDRAKGVSRPVLAGGGGFFNPATRIPLGPVESFQTLARLPKSWTPALVDAQGRTVLAVTQQRVRTFVLSDPDILNNHGLAQRENAEAASVLLNALRGYSGALVFDVSLNGFARSRDILRLMLEPPFLSATLCALACALLMGLHAAVRFGAAGASVRPFAMGKRALADNSAGLIRLARREPAMARRYATTTRDAVAREVGAPRDLGEAELGQVLERLGRARGVGVGFGELDAKARLVRDNAALMRVARNLYRWRVEMTRARR